MNKYSWILKRTLPAISLVIFFAFLFITFSLGFDSEKFVDQEFLICDRDFSCNGYEENSVVINPNGADSIVFDVFSPVFGGIPRNNLAYRVHVQVENNQGYSRTYEGEGISRVSRNHISSFDALFIDLPDSNVEYTLTFSFDFDINDTSGLDESEFNTPRKVNIEISEEKFMDNSVFISSFAFATIYLFAAGVYYGRTRSMKLEFGLFTRTFLGKGLSGIELIIHFLCIIGTIAFILLLWQ